MSFASALILLGFIMFMSVWTEDARFASGVLLIILGLCIKIFG